MTPIATALPENSGDGYVAAAYIVFFALILIYVAIMAIRLGRVERTVRQLREDAGEQARGDHQPGTGAQAGGDHQPGTGAQAGEADSQSRERETV